MEGPRVGGGRAPAADGARDSARGGRGGRRDGAARVAPRDRGGSDGVRGPRVCDRADGGRDLPGVLHRAYGHVQAADGGRDGHDSLL
eukprot:3221071-Prymnesium_polylepis.1